MQEEEVWYLQPTEQKAHGFENGEHKIIIFVTCGILLLLVTIGFCLFSWGCCGFGGCRKCNRTIRQDFYTEQFYAHQCQVNNGAESRQQITSTEHDDRYQFYKRHFYANKHGIQNENSQHTYETPQFEDNDTIHQYETIQYEDEIEEIVLPIPTQFQDNDTIEEIVLPIPTQFQDNHTIQQYETIQYKDTEEVTDGADDTDDTDDTEEVTDDEVTDDRNSNLLLSTPTPTLLLLLPPIGTT